jgi:hypothetical protein
MTNVDTNPHAKPEGEFVTTLIPPEHYARQVSQVATVWENQLRFIRRKELAMQPYEIDMIPMSGVRSIRYRQEYAILPFALGILCVAVVAFVFAAPVPDGTRFPIGALVLVGFAGFTWMLGVKRHRLEFCLERKTLRWRSPAGDFKVYTASVARVMTFASGRNLVANDSRPVPPCWSN